jgi:hypothetical protein
MYNPHQFDNSANMGPTALAVCLKSMIFLLMVVVIVGLGYWVWWLHQNMMTPPRFIEGDIVYRASDHAIGRISLVGHHRDSDAEPYRWRYIVSFPADREGAALMSEEGDLEPAAEGGRNEYMQISEKMAGEFRAEREMKAGNLHEQWEQDGRRQ